MEREEKESSETASHGNYYYSSESQPMATAASSAGVSPPLMSASMEGSVAVVQPFGERGDVAKKKRGRPRKYDENGNLRPQYQLAAAAAAPVDAPGRGGSVKTPPGLSSKKGRGKLARGGSFQLLASLGKLFTNATGADFTPHVVTVPTGQDVAGKIHSLAQQGPRGICILSANGTISNVTIRQPGSSGGLFTYEGLFEILSLNGSFTTSDSTRSRTGGLSVSLAGADGRVVGGPVVGVLLAASPIQVVIGSFVSNGHKTQKRKYNNEKRAASALAAHSAADTTTPATPTSVEAPHYNKLPTLTNNNIMSSKDHDASTPSTNLAAYANSWIGELLPTLTCRYFNGLGF